MERTLIKDTVNKVGEKVKLICWISIKRDHGKLVFLDLRDRSGTIQAVGGENLGKLGVEWIIEVVGEIKNRPEKLVNDKIPTGKIEISIEEVKVISEAKTPPFDVQGDGYELDEEIRLKYRYLDLRRERLAKNIRSRNKIIHAIRNEFLNRDFVEIETPFISKATPEGARDFLVPSRLNPGSFYALPQSPQQYKQLLMVAGFERYFQIVRCFRDEDLRADRQFEFTQVDVEMSFPTQEEILSITEEIITKVTEEVAGKKIWKKPFPRFSYEEAIAKFGADKFDLREEKDPNIMAFAWVVDFPLFEKTKDRSISPSHHPFTAPKTEDIPLLDKDPLKVRAWQHDLVCNGYEVAGGSIRITDPKVQKKIFQILGHKDREIEQKFGHLLEAFTYGVPPHGGIAWGLDRLVAILLAEKTIREVIAFPMTSKGQTSVMEAPSRVSEEQLKELHLKVTTKK